MEVYLGGQWHTFDPRNNTRRTGRVLIAAGRDAADVPLTHTFGPGTLAEFRVWADAVSPEVSAPIPSPPFRVPPFGQAPTAALPIQIP
jgi:transglutaminase-like putative cysteine protease